MAAKDYLPSAPWQNLQLRAKTLKSLRAFFDARGFVEVETPLLSRDTVIDRHLDPLPVTLFADAREPQTGPTYYLQTSPEFGMKRLLAAGEAKAIYQITRAFRGGEVGDQHNPEFTILEWYRVGDDYAAGMELLAELAREMFGASEVERITYREAFRRFAHFDPLTEVLGEDRVAGLKLGIPPPDSTATEPTHYWMDAVMSYGVQPHLGLEQPLILCDYPAWQAALANVRPLNELVADLDGHLKPLCVAERFELFYRGVELANGYHELLDPGSLTVRNVITNLWRQSDGKYKLPEESRLLDAMRHGLPPCSGCALGVDRLVMLLAGVDSLRETIAFPIDRA